MISLYFHQNYSPLLNLLIQFANDTRFFKLSKVHPTSYLSPINDVYQSVFLLGLERKFGQP